GEAVVDVGHGVPSGGVWPPGDKVAIAAPNRMTHMDDAPPGAAQRCGGDELDRRGAMDLKLSDEQTMIRDEAARYLDAHATREAVRAVIEGPEPWDAALWRGF